MTRQARPGVQWLRTRCQRAIPHNCCALAQFSARGDTHDPTFGLYACGLQPGDSPGAGAGARLGKYQYPVTGAGNQGFAADVVAARGDRCLRSAPHRLARPARGAGLRGGSDGEMGLFERPPRSLELQPSRLAELGTGSQRGLAVPATAERAGSLLDAGHQRPGAGSGAGGRTSPAPGGRRARRTGRRRWWRRPRRCRRWHDGRAVGGHRRTPAPRRRPCRR